MAKPTSKKPSPAKSAASKGSKPVTSKTSVKSAARQSAAPKSVKTAPPKMATKPAAKAPAKAAVATTAAKTPAKTPVAKTPVAKTPVAKTPGVKTPAKPIAKAVPPPAPAKMAKAAPPPPPPPAPVKLAPVKAEKPEKTKRLGESHEGRNGVAVAPPVPTDGKPAKNQAGLKSSELEAYRDLLLAKRRELVGDMSHMEREALQRGGGSNLSNLPIHMADMGTDNYEQEFTLGLMEKDRKLLREINDALAKIQNGSFGLCEATGKPIGKPRLEAQPWARFSIEHARKLEKRMMGH